MKLINCNINHYLDVCVGSVEQVYEAYYRQTTWSFIKRMLSLVLVFGRTLRIWVAIMQSKPLEQLDFHDGQYFYFINTGNYVSESFITFLESRNDMLLDKFFVRNLCNNEINDELRLKKKIKLKIFGLSLLVLYAFLKNIWKKQNSYLTYHLIIKHFQNDILPELFRHEGSNSTNHNLLFAVTDEANPRFQTWYRLTSPSLGLGSKLIHIQHGIISSESQEWHKSISDVFFVMSPKTKKYVQRVLGPEKKVFSVGPYLRSDKTNKSTANHSQLNQVLVLFQPYVSQFGSENDYLGIYQLLGILAAKNLKIRWKLRFHPVQTHSKQIKSYFKSTNCIIDRTEELTVQIQEASAVLGISSQTSYEVVACKKPLFLIRGDFMSISSEFESEFKDHLVNISDLERTLDCFDYEIEVEKSKHTSNFGDLSVATYSYDKVRHNIFQALMEIN